MTSWCPKCAAEIIHERGASLRCARHGTVVDKIWRCHCGSSEEFRAIDNVAPRAHYCERCAAALPAEIREHLTPVVARSTPTTGPWSPA